VRLRNSRRTLPIPPLLASLAVGGFQVSTDEKGTYAAAARACTNAVAVASACGTFEVGTEASGFERLTSLRQILTLRHHPHRAPCACHLTRLVESILWRHAKRRYACAARYWRYRWFVGEKTEHFAQVCVRLLSPLISSVLKLANEEAVTYLLALLPPHNLGAPHQPHQDRQSTLEPDLRTFCGSCA
jgi:hypothetical protein